MQVYLSDWKQSRGKRQMWTTFCEGLFLVEVEPNITAWFAIRMGHSTFGVFDAFLNESGRQDHLSDKHSTALAEKTNDLFIRLPTIEKIDSLAAKLPQFKKSDYEELV